MDPARICIGLGPLAIYLLILGAINLSRRPFLTTGTRDLAALGVAVCGLVIVGPIELFAPALLPPGVLSDLGPYFWLLVLGMYGSITALAAVLSPPRLVVFNITPERLRPLVRQIAARLDDESRWAGDTLELPSHRLQLRIASFNVLRNVSLVASGEPQSYDAWKHLQQELRAGLAQIAVPPNPRGFTMILFGLLITIGIAAHWIRDPQQVARGLVEMFGL